MCTHLTKSHFAGIFTTFFLVSPTIFAQEINPIVVSGSRQFQPLSEVMPSVSVITREEIDQTQARDIVQLLQTQPGLEVARNGGSGSVSSVFLRGTGNSLILVDGVALGDDGTGGTFIESIPVGQIDHIEILRGNASALYGSKAMGGVIQIFTKGGSGFNGAYASISYGSRNSMSLTTGYGATENGYKLNFNLNRQSTDGFPAISGVVYPSSYRGDNYYQTTSFSGNLSKEWSLGHEVGVKLFASQNQYSYDDTYGDTALYKSTGLSETFQIYSKNKLTDFWRSTLKFSSSYLASNTTVNYSSYYPDGWNYGSSQASQRNYSWINDFEINPSNSLLFGVEKNQINYTYTYNDPTPGYSSYLQSNRSVQSIYGGYSTKVDQFGLQFNLRNDQLSAASAPGQSANTGLLGLSYQFANNWKWTGSASTAFNAPTIYQLSSSYGNPNLLPERVTSYETGFQYSSAQTLIKFVGFTNQYNNLIGFDNSLNGGNGQYVNINSATISGVELSGKTILMGNLVKIALTEQNPIDGSTNTQLLNRSKFFGSLDISRAIDGWNIGSQLITRGAAPSVGGNVDPYSIINVYVSRHLDKEWTIRARLENLFDLDYQQVYGYNTPRFGAFLSLSYNSAK